MPAATVVVLRATAAGPEVLLTHRPATMAFAAGMHVFPGGRVEAADAAPKLAARSVVGAVEAATRLGGDPEPGEALAAHIAAVRELWEESGILLAVTSAPTGELEAAREALVAGSAAFADLAETLDLRLRTDLLAPLSRRGTGSSGGRIVVGRSVQAIAKVPAGEEDALRSARGATSASDGKASARARGARNGGNRWSIASWVAPACRSASSVSAR